VGVGKQRAHGAGQKRGLRPPLHTQAEGTLFTRCTGHATTPDAADAFPADPQLQRRRFETDVRHHSLVHEQLIQFYKGFKHDAHPMAIMVGGWGAAVLRD
jgi:hypothetical protein